MENKLTYTKVGDYYIPNLTIKPSPPIGKYGRINSDYQHPSDCAEALNLK